MKSCKEEETLYQLRNLLNRRNFLFSYLFLLYLVVTNLVISSHSVLHQLDKENSKAYIFFLYLPRELQSSWIQRDSSHCTRPHALHLIYCLGKLLKDSYL